MKLSVSQELNKSIDKKKDIVWIDWLKFICMFFVYWLHVGQLGNCDSCVTIPYGFFFVNAFFFVSGYFIFQKQLNLPLISKGYKEFLHDSLSEYGMLANMLFKIAVPSIIFSMIDFLPKSAIRGGGISLERFVFDTILRGTNWFTCALCIAELLIFLFLLTRKKNIWMYVLMSIPFFILGKMLFDNQIALCDDLYFPWFYKSGMMACLFLTVGGVFGKYEPVFDRLMNRFHGSVLIVIIFTVLWAFVILKPFRANVSVISGFDYIGIPFSLISIFGLVYLCKKLSNVNAIKYISRHSIGFFFLSSSVPFVWCKMIERIFPIGVVGFYIEFIGSFLTAWIVVFLLNRYVPAIFDLRKIKFKKLF